MYAAGNMPLYPNHLSGHHELGTASYKEAVEREPKFIGDPEKCKAIYEGEGQAHPLASMAKALADKKELGG
jgi:hypothetical protein